MWKQGGGGMGGGVEGARFVVSGCLFLGVVGPGGCVLKPIKAGFYKR